MQDSHVVKFTPLTAIIGNNGSGKSSFIEGLEALYKIVQLGLDEAMQDWHGLEHIHNKVDEPKFQSNPRGGNSLDSFRPRFSNPVSFEINGTHNLSKFSASMSVNAGSNYDQIFIEDEKIDIKNSYSESRNTTKERISDGKSIVSISPLRNYFDKWQFVSFNPQKMGEAIAKKRTGGDVRLSKDGTNIAEYLLSIYNLDQLAFQGILETLEFILPYARDLQPTLTSELERAVYLQLTERKIKIPGWLLSTGTLRLVALLAVLRHPAPPSLLIVEEIENGLDPRTINLIVDEIRSAVQSGRTQVIVTTHSPYLLDLLELDQIILVERQNSEPVFSRPIDNASLTEWAKTFSPGKLYTMNKFGTG